MTTNPYDPGSEQWRAWHGGYIAAHNDWKNSVRTTEAYRSRSSITGRFVSWLFAKDNPDTTQKERGE